MEARSQAARDVIGQVEQVILGKEERIREIMTAFLAGGHVLLEDIPGVGKTTLAMAFSRVMGLSYRRGAVYTGHPPRLSLRSLRCRARSMACLSRTRCMPTSWS